MWYGAALLLKGYHSEEASGVPLIRGCKYIEKNAFLKKNNPPTQLPCTVAQTLCVYTKQSRSVWKNAF